jgi:hypothetical protein
MCCKLFPSVHRTTVEHVHCCLLVVRIAIVHCSGIVTYVIISNLCLISLLQSVKVFVPDVHVLM